MPECRITVLKRTFHREIVDEYLTEESAAKLGLCPCFREGQEFIQDPSLQPPAGFCTWAWADIRANVMTILQGGNWPEHKPGVCIACCSDGCRPVIFKIERVE
jgi:uncharacterized repeat protein (TIGR04076 family)